MLLKFLHSVIIVTFYKTKVFPNDVGSNLWLDCVYCTMKKLPSTSHASDLT